MTCIRLYKAQFHSQYFSFYYKSVLETITKVCMFTRKVKIVQFYSWWTIFGFDGRRWSINLLTLTENIKERSVMIVGPMCSARICLLLYNYFPWMDNSKLQSINQIWGFQYDRGLWVLQSPTFPDYIASVSLFIACEPDDIKMSDETVLVTVDWSSRMAGRWDLALHSRPSLSLFLVFRLYLLLYLLPIYFDLDNKVTNLIVIA